MIHPDDNQLREFAAGRLDDAEDEWIEKHLKNCPDCLRKVTQFERSHANPLLNDVKKGLEESTENSDDEADEPPISLPEFIGNYKILGILASGHKDGTVKLWNIDSGEVIYSHRQTDGPIRSLCISRDNKKLFFLSNDMNLVDLESNTIEKTTLMLKDGTPGHCGGSCFEKEGEYVFFSAHKTLGLCSLKSHKIVGFDRDISDFPILSLKMSPDYQSMAIASGGRDVWIHENVKYSTRWFAFADDVTGKQLPISSYGDHMYCVAFANDNERLFAAGDQGEVGLWKFRGTPTLELTFPLEHHYDTVIALDVSPVDRKFLVRTRYDSTIAVWEYLDKNFHERILIEKDDATQTTQ